MVGIPATSPPHMFSFRPNLNLGIHTVLPHPARSHSPVRQGQPLLRPALSSGFPSLSSYCLLQVSKQATYPVCIWALSFVPTRV